jgi:WD40 repeat protein
MKTLFLILTITLLSPYFALAQGCQGLIGESQKLIKNRQFDDAIKKVEAAKGCATKEEIDKLYSDIFMGLKQQNKEAKAAQVKAEKAESNLNNANNKLVQQQQGLKKIERLNKNRNTILDKVILDPTMALRMAEYTIQKNPDDLSANSDLKDILSDTSNLFYSKNINTNDLMDCYSFNEKSQLIVGGSHNGKVKIWDFSGKELLSFQAHSFWVTGIEFNKEGSIFYTSSVDGIVKSWKTNGDAVKTYPVLEVEQRGALAYGIASFDLAKNGDYFVIGANHGLVKVFNIDGKEVYSNKEFGDELVWYSAISDDGKQILCNTLQHEKSAKLIDYENKMTKLITSDVTQRTLKIFVSDRGNFVIGGGYNGSLEEYDINGKKVGETKIDAPIDVLQKFEHDSVIINGEYNVLQLRQGNSRNIIELKGHPSYVKNAYLSADREWVIAGCAKNLIYWHLADILSEKIRYQSKKISNIKGATFKNQSYYVISGDDNFATVCNEKGQFISKLMGHKSKINDVAISSNAQYILTCGNDSMAKIWNIDGSLLTQLKSHKGEVKGGRFSPDNHLVATFDNDSIIILWQLNGTEIHRINAHIIPFSLVFTRDGTKISCVNGDNKIYNWNVSTGKMIESKKQAKKLYDISYSKKGDYILVNSDSTFIVMDSLNNIIFEDKVKDDKFKLLSQYSGGNYGTFFENNNVIIAGKKAPGMLAIWDIKGHKKMEIAPIKDKINSYHAQNNDTTARLLIGESDGNVSVYNDKLQAVFKQKAHDGSVNQAVFIDNYKKIMSVGDDGVLDIRPNRYELMDSFYAKFSLAELFYNDLELEPEDFDKIISSQDLLLVAQKYSEKMDFTKALEFAGRAFKKDKTASALATLLTCYKNSGKQFNANIINGDTTLLKNTLTELGEKNAGATYDYTINNILNLDNFALTTATFNFFKDATKMLRSDTNDLWQPNTAIKLGEKLLPMWESSSNQFQKGQLARIYSSKAYSLLLRKDILGCEKANKRGEELDKNRRGIIRNKPHIKLLNKKFEEAKAFYIEYKDKPYAPELTQFNIPTYAHVFLQDFRDFIDNDLITPDIKPHFEEIKKILEASIEKK